MPTQIWKTMQKCTRTLAAAPFVQAQVELVYLPRGITCHMRNSRETKIRYPPSGPARR